MWENLILQSKTLKKGCSFELCESRKNMFDVMTIVIYIDEK